MESVASAGRVHAADAATADTTASLVAGSEGPEQQLQRRSEQPGASEAAASHAHRLPLHRVESKSAGSAASATCTPSHHQGTPRRTLSLRRPARFAADAHRVQPLLLLLHSHICHEADTILVQKADAAIVRISAFSNTPISDGHLEAVSVERKAAGQVHEDSEGEHPHGHPVLVEPDLSAVK